MAKIKTNVDLTQGPIVKSIVLFAVPLLFTSIIQQLYSTVDLLFAGNVLGTNATAALGISSLLITCLVNFFIGISTGVTVAVGHLFGAKEIHKISAANRSAFVFAIVAGVVVAVFGYFFSPTYLKLMETPEGVLSEAATYLNFYFIAMIFVVLYNVAAGSLRAVGDSFTPLLAQGVGGLMNIFMNFFMLCVLHTSIAGIAMATLVSNAVAAAIAIVVLVRKGFLVLPGTAAYKHELEHHGKQSGWPALKKILVVGVPVGIQSMAITLSNIIVQHQVDLLDVNSIAAFAAYFKVELPIYFAILAIGQATTAFVSQNHGANNHERTKKGTRVCQAMGLIVTAVLSIVMLAIGYWAFWIFNQDPDVIAIGLQIISITFPFYFIYSILEVQGDAVRGLGHSVVPAIIVLVNICLIRTGLVLALTAGGVTVQSIAICYPITWTTTAICMVVARSYYERRHGHVRGHINVYGDHDLANCPDPEHHYEHIHEDLGIAGLSEEPARQHAYMHEHGLEHYHETYEDLGIAGLSEEPKRLHEYMHEHGVKHYHDNFEEQFPNYAEHHHHHHHHPEDGEHWHIHDDCDECAEEVRERAECEICTDEEAAREECPVCADERDAAQEENADSAGAEGADE